MKPERLLLLTFLVAGIAMTVGYSLNRYPQQTQDSFSFSWFSSTKDASNLPKQRRPDFRLTDLQGQTHANSEWDGKVVVVNFWATWCPPCIQEIPMFVNLQKQYGERGLQFIGIAIDSVAPVQRFIKELGINYPVFVDDRKGIEIATEFGNRQGVLPFTVVINRQGEMVLHRMGEMEEPQMRSLVLSLL
jgi:thiol-disulfide isomerase/thioredoxin